MERFYRVTLVALEAAQNDRLRIKTDLKLARLWLARQAWDRLERTLTTLKTYCLTEGADQTRGTVLLETYALEISMLDQTDQFTRMKEVYNASLQVTNALPHPRIQGTLRTCGGKMHMKERNWNAATTDFYHAFVAYDEAGVNERIDVLKYLVLANLLGGSTIDPLDAREMRAYRSHPPVATILRLGQAYRANDAWEAERVVQENKELFEQDDVLRDYLGLLLTMLRRQYIVRTSASYATLNLDDLALQLNVTREEAEVLVRELVLDHQLVGRIDAVQGSLVLDSPPSSTVSTEPIVETKKKGIKREKRAKGTDPRTLALQQWLTTLKQGEAALVARTNELYAAEVRVFEERLHPAMFR